MISETAIIYPNVRLGDNVVIEDSCIIGCVFPGYNNEETIIDDGAIIRAGTIIYAGNIIGKNFQTGNKANIRELNKIGDNVSIGTMSIVEHHVIIGNGVRLHSQVFVPEYSILDDDCWLGPHAVLTNARFPKHPNVKNTLSGAHLHRNAKIGANATVLPGISVGENSLIGAGSVVTHDVPAGKIVVGNPARIQRDVDY